MKLTNKLALPEPIFLAVKNDGYSRGEADISVTELIAPPRQVALKRQFEHAIEEDCADRIWSLLGQSIHTILERANVSGIAERRLRARVNGVTISGGMDLLHQDGKLTDYKVTTAWKFKKGEVPEEYEHQLNVYAELLRLNGEKVEELEVIGILRDWSKNDARKYDDYPRYQVARMNVPLWDRERAMQFIVDRVAAHKAAKEGLPICTAKERWARPDTWALKQQGKDKAVKLYDNETDAKNHASTAPDKLYVEHRPGESVRCAMYCSVNLFCTQFLAEKGESK